MTSQKMLVLLVSAPLKNHYTEAHHLYVCFTTTEPGNDAIDQALKGSGNIFQSERHPFILVNA